MARKIKGAERLTPVQVLLPLHQLDDLMRIASERGISRSEVIRECVQRGLDAEKQEVANG